MTPEQKLFYLSLYLGAEVLITRAGDDLPTRCTLVSLNLCTKTVGGLLKPEDNLPWMYCMAEIDIKLILKEEPSSYHEDDKANKAYWEAYHGNETLCGKLYTGLRYDKLAGILWLIQNKYDIFNLKSQDLAIYE